MPAMQFFFLLFLVFSFLVSASGTDKKDQIPKEEIEISKDPNPRYPGPSQDEIKKMTGMYILFTSQSSNPWNNKIISIEKIKEFLLPQAASSYPSYQVKANIISKENKSEKRILNLESVFFKFQYDFLQRKTYFSSIRIVIIHPSQKDSSTIYDFIGYFIPEKKSFSGLLKINNQEEGSFILEKIK